MSTSVLTNVESLNTNARDLRTRRQDNYPLSNLASAHLDCYITSRMPEPDLGDCQEYTGEELTAASVDSEGVQVIEWEKPSSTEGLIQTIRSAKADIKRLQQYRRNALSREFQRLVREYTQTTIRLYRSKDKEFRPAIVVKRPVGLKTIRVRVALKPRHRIVWKVVGFRNGRPVRATRPELYTPRVWRERTVLDYQPVVLRKAGLYRSKKVDPRTVVIHDWARIRSEFASYKAAYDTTFRLAVDELRAQIRQAYRDIGSRPKLMQSYTTHGAVELYQLGQSMDPATMRGEEVRVAVVTHAINFDPPLFAFVRFGGNGVATGSTYDELKANRRVSEIEAPWFPDEQSEEHMTQSYATPLRGQGQISMVSVSALEQTYSATSEERLAYSSVASLTKAGDYTFQWFRSLLELKDFKSDLSKPNAINNRVVQFLTWFLTHEIVQAKATENIGVSHLRYLNKIQKVLDDKFGKNAYRVLPKGGKLAVKGWSLWTYCCRAYLCWKFAVEPTIADVQTLESETREWLFGMRRTLTTLLDRLQQPSCIYHARAKFGANSRLLKLGAYYTPSMVGYEELDGRYYVTVDVPTILTFPAQIVHYGCEAEVYEGEPSISEMEMVEHLDYSHWRISSQAEGAEVSISAPTRRDRVFSTLWFPSQEGRVYKLPDESHFRYIDQLSPYDHTVLVQDVSEPVRTPDRGYEAVIRLPVYACSISHGVAFASYVMQDVMRLSRELRVLCEKLKGDLDADWWDIVKHSFDHLDSVFVAWELTPLSFVYDWLTNSHSIVTELNNLIRKEFGEGMPNPLYGIWETRRSELLAGTVRCQPASVRAYRYVASWHTVRLRDHNGREGWASMPERVHMRYRYRFEVTDDKVHLTRTGLYRVRRGEHLGYDDIIHYLPKVQVKLNGGKLTTLAALLSSFAGR